MRFWDSSALVSLLAVQAHAPTAAAWLRADPAIVVWALTPTEITSALERLKRDGLLDAAAVNKLEARAERYLRTAPVVMRPSTPGLRLRALSLAVASLAATACAGELDPPVLPVAVAPLQVAAAPAADPAARTVVVNANQPRTHIGHFHAGQRVQISILDAQWTDAPGPDLLDARGSLTRRCRNTFHRACIGNGAPFMGLVLITVTDAAAADMAERKSCGSATRIPIPTGAEFAVPFDTELQLAPNDWEDGVYNNEGALVVEVERARAKTAPATERTQLLVSARSARTFAGRFSAGEYVRITLQGGGWNNHPGNPLVGAAGHPTEKCGAVGHTCIGGEGLPLMGLFLLMSECDDVQLHLRESRTERAYVPDGVEVLLEGDANLYLAPNDFEDAFADNSGSARVQVRVLGK